MVIGIFINTIIFSLAYCTERNTPGLCTTFTIIFTIDINFSSAMIFYGIISVCLRALTNNSNSCNIFGCHVFKHIFVPFYHYFFSMYINFLYNDNFFQYCLSPFGGTIQNIKYFLHTD